MIRSFAPVVDEQAEILILGTMPGAMSLAKQEYYAHKQNHFWKIMFSLLSELPVPEKFEDKIKLLQQNNIALWDVLAYCQREGSLDSNIKNQVENDILGLLASHPKIKTIVFNGQQAQKFFKRKFGQPVGIEFYVMPSTSPAHTMKFETKLAAWSQILR